MRVYEHEGGAKPCASSVKDIGCGCGNASSHEAIVDVHAARVQEFGVDNVLITMTCLRT